MDWLAQAAGWLRVWLSGQAWLDGWQGVIAQTPDWAIVAAAPGFLLLLAILVYSQAPRRKTEHAHAGECPSVPATAAAVDKRASRMGSAATADALLQPAAPTLDAPSGAGRAFLAQEPAEGHYDVFLSYARNDNVPAGPGDEGWVTAFYKRLIAQHEKYAGRPLRVFFDQEEIDSGDDWERRIYRGLRSSSLFIAFVSPNYIASPMCRREWEEYVRLEHTLSRGDDGIKQIYLADVPNLFGDESSVSKFTPEVSTWVADIRRRNQHQSFDLRRWFADGAEQLRELDAETHIAQLRANPASDKDRDIVELADQVAAIDLDIARRLDKALLARLAPGNLDASYSNFVGRARELSAIHRALIADKVGTVVALYGLGGQGKTALAVQYAHAFAGQYATGGRWFVPCEGIKHLADALKFLSVSMDLDLPKPPGGLSDTETRAFIVKSFANALEHRVARAVPKIAEVMAQAADAHTHVEDRPAAPRGVLLILDNVDHPEILSAEEMAGLAARPDLQVIATTRLDPASFGAGTITAIPVDDMPVEDALALLRRSRPFVDEDEASAARRIIELLGGFTLGVELVGAYLSDRQEVTYRGYLARLEAEGLLGADALADDAKVAARVRHREKQIGRVVDDSTASLSIEAREILAHAAIFPPEQIVAYQLRMVISEALPEFGEDNVKPGYADPWQEVLRDLSGRRLLPAAPTSESQLPLLRMHQLVGQHLITTSTAEDLEARWLRVINLLRSLNNYISGARKKTPKRIAPLLPSFAALAERVHLSLGNAESAHALSILALHEFDRGDYVRSRDLASASLACLDKLLENEPENQDLHRILASNERTLGRVAWRNAHLSDAKVHFSSATSILEGLMNGGPHNGVVRNDLALSQLALGGLLLDEGNVPMARVHYDAALATAEQEVQREPESTVAQRVLAQGHEHLSRLLERIRDIPKALEHNSAAVDIFRRLYQQEPESAQAAEDLAEAYTNLGDFALSTGNSAEARECYEVALSAFEDLIQLKPEHKDAQRDVAWGHAKLGHLARAIGDLEGENKQFEQALEISRRLMLDGCVDPWVQRDVALFESELGEAALRGDRLAEAKERFSAAMSIFQELAGLLPSSAEAKEDLVGCHQSLGDMAIASGDTTSAKRHHEAAVAIVTPLLQEDADNWSAQLRLVASHGALGLVAASSQSPEDARRHLKAGDEIMRSLLERDRGAIDPSYWRDKGNLYQLLGDVAADIGDTEEATFEYRQALVCFEALVGMLPNDAGAREDMEGVGQRLRAVAHDQN